MKNISFILVIGSLIFIKSTGVGNKKSYTLYIGKRKSDLMFRIYDKDLELARQKNCAVEEIGSWKRLEIELKRSVAHDMVKILAIDERPLEELIRGVVKDELTFIQMIHGRKSGGIGNDI